MAETLYTNVPPLIIPAGQSSIIDAVAANLSQADKLEVAVGYVSVSGLRKLDELVDQYGIKDVKVICGMYAVEGIPGSIKTEIIRLHKKWQEQGIGDLYLVNNMTYHGKLYSFWQNGKPFRSILGSANLGAIAPTPQTRRQYELATTIDDQAQNAELAEFIQNLLTRCTIGVDRIDEIPVVHERNDLLKNTEEVSELTKSSINHYVEKETDVVFRFPIKAPKFANRFSDDRKDFTISNINVAYGKGRKNSKKGTYDPRNWFETQITVNVEVTRQPGYPNGKPFFVVTDDGYMFEAHTTAQNNKQFTAYGNDRVFGRWIKGRLVASGLLQAFDNKDQDPDRLGVVTEEMLVQSHMQNLELRKTNEKRLGKVYARNEKGRLNKKEWTEEPLDVWTLHFTD